MSAQRKDKPSFLDIIDAARGSEPVIQNASNTENQNTGKPEMANLTIKVSKARRKHWGLEAKKNNTTLTQVIIESLIAKYGDADE